MCLWVWLGGFLVGGGEVKGMGLELSFDLSGDDVRPYFLWSEELSMGELRAILAGEHGEYLRWVYAGRVLREARMQDVWLFFTPNWVSENWERLSPYLGRKREFWLHCLTVWRRHGRIG